jgi:hypothetical protein
MESDIKLVDLRKQSLKVVKESIKIAESLGADAFRFYVNPTFIKNGLVITSIVKLIAEAPPATQYLIDFAGLRNLKATVDFAKKVLVDDGEATVEEREETTTRAHSEEASQELHEEETKDADETEDTPVVSEVAMASPKKRGRKKAVAESEPAESEPAESDSTEEEGE